MVLEPKLSAAIADLDFIAARATVDGDSMVRNVLRAGLDQVARGKKNPGAAEQAMLGVLARERARYDAWLTVLGTIGNNAPFIGLFGMVLGIIEAFHHLGSVDIAGVSSNQYIMGAIGEALVATGVGILVAIPAVASYNWARSTITSRVSHTEALMRALLAGIGCIDCKPDQPADGVL
ncbi:MAG: hypothetical protein A2284_01345 [Deltaproteobacteria bacterium RIFOXYA12_FULL_61_11]|nr:MAG: hypothetical protein A2284_01345 [Deltaproteobacteria bacterium RIFOXYA12_FULL_61_11]